MRVRTAGDGHARVGVGRSASGVEDRVSSIGLHFSSVPAIVLIGAPDVLSALKHRDDLREATVFTDAEALRALDLITRQRPQVVAMERLFAATTRGLALINRIKADPALASCEIRIVEHGVEQPYVPPVPARTLRDAVPPPAPPPPAAAAAAVIDQTATLDVAGTRTTGRVEMAEGVEILLDGNPAVLIDLSAIGAQVVSPSVLKPNQRLRVALADPARPARMTGTVAWASFEMSQGLPRYRAGIELSGVDEAAVMRFCDAHRKK